MKSNSVQYHPPVTFYRYLRGGEITPIEVVSETEKSVWYISKWGTSTRIANERKECIDAFIDRDWYHVRDWAIAHMEKQIGEYEAQIEICEQRIERFFQAVGPENNG